MKKMKYLIGFLCLAGFLLLLFFTLQNQDFKKETSITNLQADLGWMPDSLSRDSIRIICATSIQQYRYQSIDGKERIVFEIAVENANKKKEDKKASEAFYEPQISENSYEWSEDKLDYRLFGTFSSTELEKIAESVKVN